MIERTELTARLEPFDSFWEGPENVEKGYRSFLKFYRYNYLRHLPADRKSRVLVISCGPGYFVNLLKEEGYTDVLGIDSSPDKIRHAEERQLNCRVENGYDFLRSNEEPFDVIFCEQELNHLTKTEILEFVDLFRKNLRPEGRLIAHALNGANPITGAEALAQNFDHYNTFTEYTMRQVLEEAGGFRQVEVFPLHLYVFWTNPLNYVLWAISSLFTLFFRLSFILYGKSNKIFSKKFAAAARK